MADDFTIADVLAWARTKPAKEKYHYWCDKCAIGQFLVETGRAASPTMGGAWWRDADDVRRDFDRRIGAASKPRGLTSTFGHFVRRLEAALDEQVSA